MSTNSNVKVSSRFEERKLEGTVSLKLSENLLEQIRYLHEQVGKIEWSGMLVYKILEGSIEDHKNMKLEATEVLPMDIGTSGYTEYEISPESDDYTFDNLSRVLMAPDLKLGHIHTHHNMDCFFSGTDTNELHDNAPNHNYYLSLIVNFEDPDAWCAKVVYVGKEMQKGTIRSSFQGTSSVIQRAIEVDKEVDVLFSINVDIQVVPKTYALEDSFIGRIDTLEEKRKERFKARKPINSPRSGRDSGIGGAWLPPGWAGYAGQGQMTMFDMVDEDGEAVEFVSKISKDKVENFLVRLFSLDPTSSDSIDTVVNMLEHQLGSDVYDEQKDAMLDILQDSVIEAYDATYAQCFGSEPSAADRYQITEEVEHHKIDEKYMDKEIFSNLLFTVIM